MNGESESIHYAKLRSNGLRKVGTNVGITYTPREVPAGAMNPHDPVLTAFDKQMRARIEIGVGQESLSPVHYVHHTGVEYVKDGLRLLSVDGGRHAATRKDLRDQCIVMPPVIDSPSR